MASRFSRTPPIQTPREVRRAFLAALVFGIRVVWPILSLNVGSIAGLGIAIGFLEGWTIAESLYFSFITGLTIGYGDLVPHSLLARGLSIMCGLCGTMLTALLAAVAVKALAVAVNVAERE